MGGWTAFLLTYLLGGVTFLPLLLFAVLLHAHLTFPVRDEVESKASSHADADSIVQPGDDTTDLKAAQKEDSKQRLVAESDPAAGYFAVCREYTPMGINAKPIERSTPVGSTTVAAPSPSVYQTMYRSIFDRKQAPGPLDDNKTGSQRPKKAGNVFYVVLRHGHLMLFDDDEQLEVRHVVSLAHHQVSVYSGGDSTPEGELWIKRNAICLTRRTDGKEVGPDQQTSKPFYLFSENCSAKEDFYFALLRNQEQTFSSLGIAPTPAKFDVKNIISLVQKLHSSEDHIQTRWLNAFIGRIFLGVHETKDIENFIREKLTKKISRVHRPSFLSRIAIQKIETGNAAPLIVNPRLKELNVEGECVMEADVKYTGNVRLEVAATARIDLGQRFKAREVNLVLAVVLRKLEGHVLFKIKAPPSNRIWFSFQTMPKMEMTIEPVVSARQITYTVILRQIENRIKEVIAETLVHPYWDDVPFFDTAHKTWRGGIFVGDDAVVRSPDHEALAAQLGNVDEFSQMEGDAPPTSPDLPPADKSHTFSVLESNHTPGFWSRKLNPNKGTQGFSGHKASSSTTNLEAKNSSTSTSEMPRPIRSGSFSASSPTISTDPTHAEPFRATSTPSNGDDAASVMANLSTKPPNASPAHTPVGSPSKYSTMAQIGESPANSSSEAVNRAQDHDTTPIAKGRRQTASSTQSTDSDSAPPDSPVPSSRNSVRSATGSTARHIFGRRDASPAPSINGSSDNKRNTLAAVSNVALTAKQWGLNAFQRQRDRNASGRKLSDPTVDLSQPMGRGQPLPPPGTPLPGPRRKAATTPKRKPVAQPPPAPPAPQPGSGTASRKNSDGSKPERRAVPPPPLPTRRRRISNLHLNGGEDGGEENDLVVEAPPDDASEPGSPAAMQGDRNQNQTHQEYEDSEEFDADDGNEGDSSTPDLPPPPRSNGEGEEEQLHDEEEEEDYSNWFEDEGDHVSGNGEDTDSEERERERDDQSSSTQAVR